MTSATADYRPGDIVRLTRSERDEPGYVQQVKRIDRCWNYLDRRSIDMEGLLNRRTHPPSRTGGGARHHRVGNRQRET